MTRVHFCGWKSRHLKIDPLFCRPFSLRERAVFEHDGGEGPRSRLYLGRDRKIGCAAILISVGLHALALWPGNHLALGGGIGASGSRPMPPSDAITVVNVLTRAEPDPPREAHAPEAVEAPRIAMPQARLARVGSERTVRAERVAGLAAAGVVMLRGNALGVGSTEETEDTFVSPRARSILPTWTAPRTAQGFAVLVRVHTDAQGRATGWVELVNPTPHGRTNQTIIDQVKYLEYWPARKAGVPVAAWAEILYVFCHDGTTATSPPGLDIDRSAPCVEDLVPSLD